MRKGQGAVGSCPSFVWCPLGFSRNCKEGLTELEGPFCGEEKEKDLEVYSVVHFWDSLEGEK